MTFGLKNKEFCFLPKDMKGDRKKLSYGQCGKERTQAYVLEAANSIIRLQFWDDVSLVKKNLVLNQKWGLKRKIFVSYRKKRIQTKTNFSKLDTLQIWLKRKISVSDRKEQIRMKRKKFFSKSNLNWWERV